MLLPHPQPPPTRWRIRLAGTEREELIIIAVIQLQTLGCVYNGAWYKHCVPEVVFTMVLSINATYARLCLQWCSV